MTFGRADDIICLEYDAAIGKLFKNSLEFDSEDEGIIGQNFIDSFVDSQDDIAFAHHERFDTFYEITRFNS